MIMKKITGHCHLTQSFKNLKSIGLIHNHILTFLNHGYRNLTIMTVPFIYCALYRTTVDSHLSYLSPKLALFCNSSGFKANVLT